MSPHDADSNSANTDPVTERGFNTQEVQNAARDNLNFFAALTLPTVFEFDYPPVFLAVWSWLLHYVFLTRDFSKLALGLPRGFGKTTLMKLFVLYCILYTDRKFILILSSTANHAQNFISDVADMLDEPNIKAVYGDWRIGIEKETQDLKKFSFRGRPIILAGLGEGGTVRGLNLKNSRPDVMIMEDMQTSEAADSQVLSNKIYRWMLGTLMKAKNPTRCMYLFVANMYPTEHSILRKLKSNPQWVKFIAGGILANGESLWEDLQPIEQLLLEYENDIDSGHPEIFHAEVLNDENISKNTLLDLSKLPAYPYDEGELATGKFIVIDPSNDKINSDAVSIGYFECLNMRPVLRVLKCGRFSPFETIRETLTIALERGCSSIFIEANAYQYSLKFWFEFVMNQLGITGIRAEPIYSGTRSKNSRILDMFKAYAKGELFIHPSCVAEAHMQMADFNPLTDKNTDGILDLLTYAPRVLGEFSYLIAIDSIEGTQEADALGVIEFNSCF